jgi:serine/threonine-protein kinase
MAHVWVARHVETSSMLALKMLMPHLAENRAFREMFFDEARIASRVHHPNVCATYDLVELDGVLAIVMEWVDGSSLLRVLRPRGEQTESVALPLRHAVKIVAETSAGLHAAHELRGEHGHLLSVVHRDVSPHNILLTRGGQVKVTDFGVAKALGKLHMTIAGQVKGKLAYMSPEQLVGGDLDRRSDVFALGTVLYEATTGRRPFQGEHDPQVMSAIVMGNFDPPSAVVPNYPPALEAVVLRAMASEPSARYANALQLRQALEAWLDSTGPAFGSQQIALLLRERCGAEVAARLEALSMPPPSLLPSRRPRSDGRSHKPSGAMGFVGNAFAVLLGLGLGIGVLFYVRETRRARAAAALTRAPAVVAAAQMLVDSGTSAIQAPQEVLDGGDLDDVPPPKSNGGITLIVPENARLFVDGKFLPPGTTSVSRPNAGVKNVLVRAEGREDTVVVLDPTSPDELEVPMPPRKRPRPTAQSPAVTPPPNPYE